jgi:hypothetical protein
MKFLTRVLAAGRLGCALLSQGGAPPQRAMRPATKGRSAIRLARVRRLGIPPRGGLPLTADISGRREWVR